MVELAELAAQALADAGWTLRSGHAEGMDRAFGRGAGAHAEVYLPWPSFEAPEPVFGDVVFDRPTAEARDLASHYHPAWAKLSDPVRALHARNMHEVLGRELDSPVTFVVCWTPGAEMTGGTAQALRLAQARSIPIFNLAREADRQRIERWLPKEN